MSAVADEIVVADEPISTVPPMHDNLNTLEISGKLATDGEVLNNAANCVKEVATGSEDVPGVDENNDGKSVTTSSDAILATSTSVEALTVVRVNSLVACCSCVADLLSRASWSTMKIQRHLS